MKAAARTYRRLEPLLEQYIARHGKPDIIHAHNLSSGGLIAMQASWKTGVPYVVTEHTGAYVANPGAAERDAEILVTAAKEARAVLAVGTQLADALRLVLGGRPVWVIPNVADSQLFEYPTRAPEGQFTVVGLGNLIPSKNYALLVKAFAAADLPPDSMLLIGGRGPEAGKLTDIARSLGIEDRVQLAGYLDRSAVASLFQRSHLFAHPSDSESFGVVLIEALALGLPVLATASSGPQDIVTPDVGLLTPVGDVSAFAKGLSDMYGRRDEFTPQRLRAICLERFGPEIFASRLLEVYREALA